VRAYNPRDGFISLYVSVIYFGEAELNPNTVRFAPIYPWLGAEYRIEDINWSRDLLPKLKSLLDDGKTRLQFKLHYADYSSYAGDSENHGIEFNSSDAKLEVTYLE